MSRFTKVLSKQMTTKEALDSLAEQIGSLRRSKHPKDKKLRKRLEKEVDDIMELEIPSPKVDRDLDELWTKGK